MATAKALKESKATNPPGAAEQNGHLTKADEYRRNVSAELADALAEFDELTGTWEGLKADTADAKKDVDGAQRRVNRLAAELRDIENGCYQPKLLDKAGAGASAAAVPRDGGAEMPIDTLAEFSMTQAKIDLLKESKFEIKTVGDLERTMRENANWHRDIKGLGQAAIDKLIDVLVEFRLSHPVPVPGEEPDLEAASESAAAEESADLASV